MIRVKSLLSGATSYLPGGNAFLQKRIDRRFGGTASSRYCYSVWMRHLLLANEYGAISGVPSVVAELGPGRSLGTGLAALLTGVDRYIALEFVDHGANSRNVEIFDELVEMFRRREPVPDSLEFPQIVTTLQCYEFPFALLTEEVMASALRPARVQAIRDILIGKVTAPIIKYAVPWNAADVLEQNSVDMLFSMSVMEHVDDLESTYAVTERWLKPLGIMSHEIDFKCHNHASRWNGHWGYSDLVWKVIRGRRPYLINREPFSRHREIVVNSGFETLVTRHSTLEGGIPRRKLSERFEHISDEDLETSNAFMLSRKINVLSRNEG